MIQIILMLLGLAFPNNNTNTTNNNPTTANPQGLVMAENPDTGTGGSDTGGETGTTLPPKK